MNFHHLTILSIHTTSYILTHPFYQWCHIYVAWIGFGSFRQSSKKECCFTTVDHRYWGRTIDSWSYLTLQEWWSQSFRCHISEFSYHLTSWQYCHPNLIALIAASSHLTPMAKLWGGVGHWMRGTFISPLQYTSSSTNNWWYHGMHKLRR